MNKLYEAWLNSSNVDMHWKESLKALSKNDINIFFSDNKIKMGTAGYRAIIGPGNFNLNEFTYYQLTDGYAKWLKHKYPNKKIKILIVHDNRKNGDKYAHLCANVLINNYHFDVVLNFDNQLLPTPIASYLVKKFNYDGCINITASHNPKEYNGFKCYDNTGCQLLPNDSDFITNNMIDSFDVLDCEINFNPNSSLKYITQNQINNYFSDISKALNSFSYDQNKRINLVYSSMHGTASFYMSKFLSSLGFNCIDVKEQNYPDPEFTNTPICNPENPESLKLAISLADKLNINIVLASDPDADRLAIAIKKNNEWIYLNGNQAGIIETYYRLLKLKNDSRSKVVISTYISNNLIDRIVDEYKGRVIRTATGFKWIGNEINKLDPNKEVYVNGFEEAIGALPVDINRDKDSFQTALLILNIINYYYDKNWDLIDVLENEIYPKYGYWFGNTYSYIIAGNDWKLKAQNMMELILNYKQSYVLNRKVINIMYNDNANCVEMLFENDSWVKFRISGTEPKFKIYVNLYNNDSNNKYNISKSLLAESNELVNYFKKYLSL